MHPRYLALRSPAWLALVLSGCTLVFGSANQGVTNTDGGTCACETPPSNACLDATTMRVYVSHGACGTGSCVYAHTDVICQSGCADSACVGDDPCDGITCLAPPQNSCTSDGSLLTFASSGTCAGGTCSYESTSSACANGCSDGACMSASCSSTTCDQPPATECATTTTLRTYAASGTCTAGTCAYTHKDTTCTAPTNATATCATNACVVTCNAGYVKSSGACVVGTTPGGLTWTTLASGTQNDLYVVWGSSSSDIYVGGENGVLLHSSDGSTFATLANGTTTNIDGIWGSSASDVYFTGLSAATLHTADGGKTFTSLGSSSLLRIWGSSATDVWGISEATNSSGDIVHSATSGQSWTTVDATYQSGYFLQSVWGTSASDVYVVGTDNGETGTVWHTINGGATYTQSLVGADVFAAWGPSLGTVYALGNGTINYSSNSGSTWTPQASGASAYLVSMAGSSPSEMYIAGYSGTLLYGDGQSWSSVTTGNANDFHRIWYAGDGSYYVVGGAGTILHGHK